MLTVQYYGLSVQKGNKCNKSNVVSIVCTLIDNEYTSSH